MSDNKLSNLDQKYNKFKSKLPGKFLPAVLDGTLKAFQTAIFLLKIMIPIYVIVVLIKFSPLMPWLQSLFMPVMKIFNLPGDAVIPVVMGLLTDEYAIVAAMSSFNFSAAACTTIAMVTLTAHSLPVETAIAKKIGFPALGFAVFRLGSALGIGILVGWIGGIFL